MQSTPTRSHPIPTFGLASAFVSAGTLLIGALLLLDEWDRVISSTEEPTTIVFHALVSLGLTTFIVAGGLLLSTVLAVVALWKKERKVLPSVSLTFNAIVLTIIFVLLVQIRTG